MSKFKIYALFYLIIVLIYFLLGARFIYTKDFNELKIKNLYLDEIKTGDTFMVSYQQFYRIFGDSLIGLNFTHSSTAYWENGKLYFVEYAYYTEEYNGIMKMPYHEWIKFNKNALILVNKLKIINDEIVERKILNDKIKLFLNDFERKDDLNASFNLGWNRFRQDYKNSKEPLSRFWNSMLGQPNNVYKRIDPDNNKETTCVEITACLLCEIGIIKKNKSISYLPSKFIGMKGFDCNTNFDFSEHYICDLSNFKHL